jgi:hypothetical protein
MLFCRVVFRSPLLKNCGMVQVAALPGLFACIQDGDCAPGERSALCIEIYTHLLLGAHGGPNAIQTTLRLGIVERGFVRHPGRALDVAQYAVKGTCPASCTFVAQLVALSCARMVCLAEVNMAGLLHGCADVKASAANFSAALLVDTW